MTFPSSQQSQYQTRREGDLESFVSGDLVSGLIRLIQVDKTDQQSYRFRFRLSSSLFGHVRNGILLIPGLYCI